MQSNLANLYHHHHQLFVPLQADSLHKCRQRLRSCASLIHNPPATTSMLSLHLFFCLPGLLFLPLGIHSVDFFAHRLLCIRAMCPAQLHFSSFVLLMMSVTFVCARIASHLHKSFLVIFKTALSIDLCATWSLCCCSFVSVQVSAPYVIAGMMTPFIIFLLRHIGIALSFRNSLYCPNLCQPAVILLSISLFMFLFGVINWPR